MTLVWHLKTKTTAIVIVMPLRWLVYCLVLLVCPFACLKDSINNVKSPQRVGGRGGEEGMKKSACERRMQKKRGRESERIEKVGRLTTLSFTSDDAFVWSR